MQRDYNNRQEMDDCQVTGKRLTYEHLIGRDREAGTEPAPTVM
jgi:hypothetical protein